MDKVCTVQKYSGTLRHMVSFIRIHGVPFTSIEYGMDKQLHLLLCVGRNYLLTPKTQHRGRVAFHS